MTDSGQRPAFRPGIARALPGPATLEQEAERLHDELDRLLARAGSSDSRAGKIYQAAHEASGMSGHEFARTIKRNERLHRMYRRGVEASVTLDGILRMPRASQLAILRELHAVVRETAAAADGEENSARGAA